MPVTDFAPDYDKIPDDLARTLKSNLKLFRVLLLEGPDSDHRLREAERETTETLIRCRYKVSK